MSPTVTVSELRNDTSTRALLVDVRSATEFASGHIPGAVNIPMDQIEARLDDLGRNFPLVLICQSGKRARMTAACSNPVGGRLRSSKAAQKLGSKPASPSWPA